MDSTHTSWPLFAPAFIIYDVHEGRDLEQTDSEADTKSEYKARIWKQLTWPKELGETQKQPEPKY